MRIFDQMGDEVDRVESQVVDAAELEYNEQHENKQNKKNENKQNENKQKNKQKNKEQHQQKHQQHTKKKRELRYYILCKSVEGATKKKSKNINLVHYFFFFV